MQHSRIDVRLFARSARCATTCCLALTLLAACSAKSIAPTQPNNTNTPVDPPVPIPTIPVGPERLAAATFDDSTFGDLTNDTPGHNSIVDDPTASGHGKILKINYASLSDGANADLNQFASWDPIAGLSHGSTFYFIGQVYFPTNTAHFTDALRKLIYFRTNLGTDGQQCDYVLNMFGTDVGLEISAPSIGDVRWGGLYTMPLGKWVTIEVSIAMNSAPGVRDGSTTVWINGKQVLAKTGIAFTQASDPADTRWSWLAIGTQREGTAGDTAIDELRYWDSIGFATRRIGAQ